ncbi:MAG: AAA family ATPase [Caldilineaceae bacterium]|nr:AAA family ATPase [Caldilineaceae bacterium]
MVKQAGYGTQNGQGIAGETVDVRPQAGALELSRIVDAMRSGQSPEPEDVAAVKALHPDGEQEIEIDKLLSGRDPADLVADLHSDDPNIRRTAWEQFAPLLPPDPLPLTRLSEIGKPPDRSWLIRDWMPRGRVGMLTGAGGRGKSWLALQLAARVVTGSGEWLSRWGANDPAMRPVEARGPVLYATWEDETVEFVRRIGIDMAAKCKDLHIVDLAGSGPVWGLPVGSSTQARGGLLETGRQLRAAAEQIGAILLIVDSLAGAYGSNENDRAAVREFMAHWDAWGRSADCTVMLIAHPPKEEERAGRGGYSGSTDWHGASRWRWELSSGEQEDDRERLACEKASYAMRPDPVYLERVEKSANGLIAGQWREAADQNPQPADTGDKECQGTTRKGERCRRKATEGGYCKQHQDQRRPGQSEATPGHNGTANGTERYTGPSTSDLGG